MGRIVFWIFTIASGSLFFVHFLHLPCQSNVAGWAFAQLIMAIVVIHALRLVSLWTMLKVAGIDFYCKASPGLDSLIEFRYDAACYWLFTLVSGVAIFFVLLLFSILLYAMFPVLRFAVSGSMLSYLLLIQHKLVFGHSYKSVYSGRSFSPLTE